jgi:hypothetical protein
MASATLVKFPFPQIIVHQDDGHTGFFCVLWIAVVRNKLWVMGQLALFSLVDAEQESRRVFHFCSVG